MKKSHLTLLFLICCLATAPLYAEYTPKEKKDATKTWLKGFEYFEKANKALQNEQLRKANTMFKMAESIFEKIRLRYPKWNNSLITFRLQRCRLKLLKIKDELAKKHIKLTNTDVDKENLELQDKIDDLNEKLNKTRKELSTALYSLEEARREAARNIKSSHETTSLLREKAELQKRCALLEADNERLQKNGASAVSDENGKKLLNKTLLQLDGLKKENAALKATLSKERSEFAKLAKDRVKIQYDNKLAEDTKKRLTEQIEILNARIVEMRSAAKKTSEEKSDNAEKMKTLSEKLAKSVSDLNETREKLRQSRLKTNSTAIVKQLENENALLLQDVELANLKLEKSLKVKKIAISENKRLKLDIKKLKDSLAAMDSDRSQTAATLEELSKKLFQATTIVKRQDKALEEKEKQIKSLTQESKNLAAQCATLAKKDKDFADLAKENEILKSKLTKSTTSLATLSKECAKSSSELETVKKKLFVSQSLSKKQATIIDQERKKTAEFKQRCDDLTKKFAPMAEKEKAFAELAKRSIKTENENSMLKADIKQARTRIDALIKDSKRQESRIVQLHEELKKLISENAKANHDMANKNTDLIEKNKAITEQMSILQSVNNDLKKNSTDATRKLSMVTEELVNAKLEVDKLRKLLATKPVTPKKTAKPISVAPKEPSAALASGKLVALKRRNTELLSKLQEQELVLNRLKKEKNEAVKATATLSPTEKKRIEKMLDSAALAEKEKKKEAAIWYYEKVLEDDPENSTALAKLAYVKAEKGDNDEAIKLLNKTLAKTPDDLELLQTLAVCYSRNKEYYKALGAAAKANSINPKDPVTQRYLGIICSHLGWIEAAKRQFRSSFKLDPTSAETAYNAAVLLLTTKNGLPEAKLWYDKAIQLGAQRDKKIEELFKK